MAEPRPAVQHPFISVGTRGFDPRKLLLWWDATDALTVMFDHTIFETYTGSDRLLLLAWLVEHSIELRTDRR
jgi:hypothetical protein